MHQNLSFATNIIDNPACRLKTIRQQMPGCGQGISYCVAMAHQPVAKGAIHGADLLGRQALLPSAILIAGNMARLKAGRTVDGRGHAVRSIDQDLAASVLPPSIASRICRSLPSVSALTLCLLNWSAISPAAASSTRTPQPIGNAHDRRRRLRRQLVIAQDHPSVLRENRHSGRQCWRSTWWRRAPFRSRHA